MSSKGLSPLLSIINLKYASCAIEFPASVHLFHLFPFLSLFLVYYIFPILFYFLLPLQDWLD